MKGVDPNPFPQSPPSKSTISEEDLIMLESLVKSPAFGALKRLLTTYKLEVAGTLERESDPPSIYRAQGRLIGMRAIENVSLVVNEWRTRQKVEAERAAALEKRNKRLKAQDPRQPVR